MPSNTMAKPIATQARRLRHLPAWQIVQRYKRAGYTQWALAKAAKVSQGTVANAIHRRQVGPAIERVWAVLEEVLTQKNGDGT